MASGWAMVKKQFMPHEINVSDSKHHDRTLLIIVFGAACLFFSTLEYLIPKPPFFRVGLSNLPVMLALPILGPGELLALTLVKVLGQSLVGGTLFSYVALFSAGGSIASAFIMYVAHRLLGHRLGWLGISLLGAAASNAVQMGLSVGLVFGPGAWFIIPLFMALGLGSGILVGFAAMVLSSRSRWYHSLIARYGLRGALPMRRRQEPLEPARKEASVDQDSVRRRRGLRIEFPKDWDFMGRVMGPGMQGILALLVFPAFLMESDLYYRIGISLFWLLMALFAGKRLQPLYFISMVASIAAFNLVIPAGEVLFSVAGFTVTGGALSAGISKGLGFVGQVFISLALVRPGLRLPGVFGAWLAEVVLAYQILLTRRRTLSGGGITDLVDGAMESLEEELGKNKAAPGSSGPNLTAQGLVIFFSIISIHWVPLLFP